MGDRFGNDIHESLDTVEKRLRQVIQNASAGIQKNVRRDLRRHISPTPQQDHEGKQAVLSETEAAQTSLDIDSISCIYPREDACLEEDPVAVFDEHWSVDLSEVPFLQSN